MPEPRRVLVLGATGYVGGRLVPELLSAGVRVRCLTRTPQGLGGIGWASDVEIVEGDLSDAATLDAAFDAVDEVVYLVHSLGAGDDFMQQERVTARHTRVAAEAAGVSRIVYVGGLGDDADDLSPHLRSRHDVGLELAAGSVPVTELRAAIILGAGSASFEMLRSLVEVLPLMIAPRWVTQTRVQPIAIGDLLTYLVAAIVHEPTAHHEIFEIGAPDVVSYRDLMHTYADVAGLRRRLVIPVPFLTPRLSAHWVNVVTPLPKSLADSLIDSLKNDVVVTNDRARALSSHEPIGVAAAIEAAISSYADLDIPTRWSGFSARQRAARPAPWDPEWSGGTVYEDTRTAVVEASPAAVQRVVRGIGGERGWYGFEPLWIIRGAMDKLVGGVGLRRGRRHPDEILVGEALDFWRVDTIEPDLFRLHAEMKLPGDAWIEWRTVEREGGGTEIVQRARFVPRGIFGRLYWWTVVPFHIAIFPVMLRRIAAATA
ncbi:MAG TPA: SDR family oxidoreductase [Ilumatobacteraceae bacterium]|nr:SDR family oxidoreductase [Ilumatobacteraceae bacterium]